VLTAILVTVVAIVVGFAAPTSANDRPSDPFGNHTIELDNEAPLFEIWESLRDKVLVAAVYYSEEWLILDNLTNLLVRDSEKKDYEPTVVLDYKGARRYLSVWWIK
jgi:hypothetical protein